MAAVRLFPSEQYLDPRYRAPWRPQAADKALRPRSSGASFFYNSGVLKPATTAQTELEMVTLDQRVPGGHLLRLIDAHIRFDFIRQKAEGLYCANNGRPAIDPVVLFKMLTQKARTPGKTGGSSAVSGAAAPFFLVQKDVLALL